MIFPINVHKDIKDAGKLDNSDKGRLYLSLLFVSLVFLVPLTYWICNTLLRIPVIYGFLVLLVFGIIFFIFIFRHFIFKEEEKLEEYENSRSDSLSRYFYLRKDIMDSSIINNYPVNIFEYADGTSMFCLKIRYGSNERKKFESTKQCYSDIFKLLTNNRLESRTINLPDKFEETAEYRILVEKISNIEDLKLSNAMLQIVDNMLDTSSNSSNVMCTNLLVRTKNSYQKYELPYIIKELLSIIQSKNTSFKTVEFLDKDKLISLMREFYGLEAIDLSMIKAIEPSRDLLEAYLDFVSIYQIRTDEGKSYSLPKTKINSAMRTNLVEIGGNK